MRGRQAGGGGCRGGISLGQWAMWWRAWTSSASSSTAGRGPQEAGQKSLWKTSKTAPSRGQASRRRISVSSPRRRSIHLLLRYTSFLLTGTARLSSARWSSPKLMPYFSPSSPQYRSQQPVMECGDRPIPKSGAEKDPSVGWLFWFATCSSCLSHKALPERCAARAPSGPPKPPPPSHLYPRG